MTRLLRRKQAQPPENGARASSSSSACDQNQGSSSSTTRPAIQSKSVMVLKYSFFMIVLLGGLLVHNTWVAPPPEALPLPFPSHQGSPLSRTLPPPLHYGVELSFLVPMDYLKKALAVENETDSETDDDDNAETVTNANTQFAMKFNVLARQSFQNLTAELWTRGSIKAGVLGHRKTKPQTWSISNEKTAFEIASYLSPPREEIQRLLEICQEVHFQVDPEMTFFHINVDARNRTKEQVRNVYKNFMAVEEALNTLYSPVSFGLQAAKRNSISANSPEYDSLAARYNSLYNPHEFPYPGWDQRTMTNGTVTQQAKNFYINKAGNKVRKGRRPKLCLRPMSGNSNVPKTFEFRNIESSMDGNVVWAWVQFARRLVSASFEGVVLEPVERSPTKQWEALFTTLIQDDFVEQTLKTWRDTQPNYVRNDQRDALILPICDRIGGDACRDKKLNIKGVKSPVYESLRRKFQWTVS